MTDQPVSLDKTAPLSVSPETESQARRSGADAISAALEWLAGANKDGVWTDFTMLDRSGDAWVTAYVVARLGEFPQHLLPGHVQAHLQGTLEWLERQRVSGSGWSSSSSREPDAFCTAWAILALRAHGRGVPRSSIDFLLGCRQANGGFSLYPHGTHTASNPSTTDVTVTAVRALGMCDSAAEEFLASRLRSELPSSSSLSRVTLLYACSEILDWESGLAPWGLLTRASQCTAQFDLEKPYEQALLLRSLVRLRNQRAWPAAAALRDLQQMDGSWPASSVVGPVAGGGTGSVVSFADSRVISTTTAVSALVMNESQPGLYFGSDMPQPRRFRES